MRQMFVCFLQSFRAGFSNLVLETYLFTFGGSVIGQIDSSQEKKISYSRRNYLIDPVEIGCTRQTVFCWNVAH